MPKYGSAQDPGFISTAPNKKIKINCEDKLIMLRINIKLQG